MGTARGFTEVKTPQLYDSELWKTSGHWGKYHANMFITETEGHEFGLKPMNCPGHAQLFKTQHWSYRDLPVRYAEPGLLHRNELSGTLHGLLRVRHFVQDDAHIFCTEDQVEAEVRRCLEQAFATFEIFGFEVELELSTRPDERIGSDELWDRAEGTLEKVLQRRRAGLPAEPRRRRVLRAEDRPAHDRFARALLAAGHGPAGLLDARALRAQLHRRRQRRAPAR